MQRGELIHRPGTHRPNYVQIPREDYPYVLAYLCEKFGDVRRAGNVFWTFDGEPKEVAVLFAPDTMMLPGMSLFTPQMVKIPTLTASLKKRGRPRAVKRHLYYCRKCLSFFALNEESSYHRHDDDNYPLQKVGEFNYVMYFARRKPLYQTRGWVNPELLYSELTKYTDPRTAGWLVDLRINALREGQGVTLEELVRHIREPEKLFSGIVIERALAHEDRAVSAGIRNRTPATGTPAPAPARPDKPSPEIPIMGVAPGKQTFVDWRIIYNGTELTRQQKLVVAIQAGIPLDTGAPEVDRESDAEVTQAMQDAVEDASLYGVDTEEEADVETRPPRKDKTRWRSNSMHRKRLTWKDYKGPSSIRHVPPDQKPDAASDSYSQPRAQVPTQEEPADLEQERKEFFEAFNLTPEDVLYEKEGGFIKAAKQVFSQSGMRRVEVFNRPLMPQRILTKGEFDDASVRIAEELAGELGGTVLVSEQRMRGLKSLAVAVKGYTVRVDVRPLPPDAQAAPQG